MITSCLSLAGAMCFAACATDEPSSADGGSGPDGSAPTRDGALVRDGSPLGDDDGGPTDNGGSADDGGSTDGPPAMVDECASPDTNWVFCSSFEEGNLDVWDDYDGNPAEWNQLIENPGPFGLSDNHVMRLRVPPGRGGTDLVKALPSGHDRLYARWYIQYEPGFDLNARNHGGGLFAGDRSLLGRSGNRPTGADWYTAWLEHSTSRHVMYSYTYYAGMYQDCVDPAGSCWGDSLPCVSGGAYCERPQHLPRGELTVIETGRWYCIELLLDGGTPTPSEAGANGTINWWMDGAPAGPFDDLWLRSNADLDVSFLWLSLFHHAEHSDEGVMYDHVVVSTERIGCLSAP